MRTREALAAIAMIAALAACSAGEPASVSVSRTPGKTPTASPASGPLTHFRGWDVALDYPATWRQFPPTAVALWWMLVITSATPPDTCCNDFQFEEGAVYFSLSAVPRVPQSWDDGTGSPPGVVSRSIGGITSLLDVGGPIAGNRSDGSKVWTLRRAPGHWYQFSIAWRGPGVEPLVAEAEAILDTVVFFDPLASPSPA